MRKFNTAPISGTQELLPGLQVEFDRLKNEIMRVYLEHGFLHIETPMIERTDVLLAKAGGETEKQIYKVVKTAETADEADQALRFDHTVSLARYAVEHMNDLTFPFKVTQIGRNFRGERAQKGRFREFYQCDVDVIGWEKLPIAYDAEVIAALIAALRVFPLPKFVVRVSNRKILRGLLAELALEEMSAEILAIVDHAEKVPPEVTNGALVELGIKAEKVAQLERFLQIRGRAESVVASLREFGFENQLFLEGVAELERVLSLLEGKGLADQIEADMLIVRGLDYYTGTVFETVVPEYLAIGSICSGGRYDNLAENYTKYPLPSVGGSIGLTRLFWILRNYKLIELADSKPIDIGVVPISEQEFAAAETVAGRLRQEGNRVELVLLEKSLGDKMKYISKLAKKVVVVGEDEIKSGKFQLKDLVTGEVETI